jgi:hypothetical protein
MVSPAIGTTIGIGSTLVPSFRTWYLLNLDTNEKLVSQFEAVQPTENVTSNWEGHTSLNRSNTILQFLNGENDTLSFGARFYQDSVLGVPLLGRGLIDLIAGGGSPYEKLQKLKSWARIDPSVRRPPILHFGIGDGHIQMTCVISALTDIAYGRPDFFGGFKDVSLTVDLLKFEPFSLEDEGATETRYARTREREYYEMLAYIEYNNPLLGDIIRKDHPTKPSPKAGDIVKLPSIDGIRQRRVTQTSLALAGAYSRKDTPQRRLRLEVFDRLNKKGVSHKLQPSTQPAT